MKVKSVDLQTNFCNSKRLEISNITKYYNNEPVIKNISLNLRENETASLLGVSGVGKTTLFNIIAGLHKPDEGKILLNDDDITGIPGKIGYMPQKDLLIPYKTVLENVSLPLIIKGTPKKEAYLTASDNFKRFGLFGCEKKYPYQLSGGMRQRAALLRTYMFNSQIMLLDEPFSALDVKTRDEMYQWFTEEFSNKNISTMIITHNISEAIKLSDRIYVMANQPGEIAKEFEDCKNKDEIKPQISSLF